MSKPFPLESYITRCLRRIFAWYPPKTIVKEAAQRGKDQYECAICCALHPRKSIVIDHIEAVVDPVDGFQGYDILIARLFCAKENLQAVCKACHTLKTKAENTIRRQARVRRS